VSLPDPDTLTGLLAAWLLIALTALWAGREKLRLSRRMLFASLRGLLQLLVLASILHLVFDIEHVAAQAGIILLLCLIAARVSAGHYSNKGPAWLAAATGLALACLMTLPWLVFSGAISQESRALIPLASMVVANAMNAVSLMLDRIASGQDAETSIKGALIPPMDSLRVVGLVHLPGIFVGMLLAGASPLAAASAQLVVLYMIVASTFTACVSCRFMLNRLQRKRACA
jgi:putative ABC transport system permease protein